MTKKNNYDQCKIVVSGAELVEFKRHGHEIPECPGLDSRIQKHNGEKPFTLTYEELGWLASVLDAVLNDPKGYPCVEHNPWNLKYVPKTDPRYETCKQLHSRLEKEEDRAWNLNKKNMRK